MAAKQHNTAEISAVDVIWNTKLESSAEKMVVYYLASKHQLGERVTSTYMTASQFVGAMQEIWIGMRELTNATQLSAVKVEKSLQSLLSRGIIKKMSRPLHSGGSKENVDIAPQETVYDLTDKIFREYTGGQAAAKTPKVA